jgi:phospholipid/cholesterol/gamma-HCH transport system substrate-binding protein
MKGSARLRVALLAGVTVVAGCGVSVNSLPLPKPGVSGASYTVHAIFANALNLPDHAKVELAGANVGVVTDISTRNYQADVTMQITDDVQLPTTTTAQLRQATPLGDVYVSLSMPAVQSGAESLHNGDTIPVGQTSAGATVEDLLVSLSMLFNGAGIARLARITGQLDSVVGGRGPQLSDLLRQLTAVVTGLHTNSQRIDAVLAQFDTTFGTLSDSRATLGQVADTLPGLVGTLAADNKTLGTLIDKVAVTSAALGDFSTTTGDQLSGLVDSTNRLMGGIDQVGGSLAGALDELNVMYPKILASMRGSSLITSITIQYLSIGVLYDKGGRWLGLSDVVNFAGSLVDVLNHVYQRVTGKPNPNYPFAHSPWSQGPPPTTQPPLVYPRPPLVPNALHPGDDQQGPSLPRPGGTR